MAEMRMLSGVIACVARASAASLLAAIEVCFYLGVNRLQLISRFQLWVVRCIGCSMFSIAGRFCCDMLRCFFGFRWPGPFLHAINV